MTRPIDENMGAGSIHTHSHRGDLSRTELGLIEGGLKGAQSAATQYLGKDPKKDYITALPIRAGVNQPIIFGDRKISRNPEDKPTNSANRLGMQVLVRPEYPGTANLSNHR